MSNTDPYFRGSCTAIRLADCAVGSVHIDPCSCYHYYQCDVGLKVNRNQCANGTAFDHVNQHVYCGTENEVILKDELCKVDSPWARCNRTAHSAKMTCQGVVNSTPVPMETSEENYGAIVGAVFSGLIFVVLIVIAVILYKKCYFEAVHKHIDRIRKSLRAKTSRHSVQNPQYDLGSDILGTDQPYSTIDDVMNDPTYSGTTASTNGSEWAIEHAHSDLSDSQRTSPYVEPNNIDKKCEEGRDNPTLKKEQEKENPLYIEIESEEIPTMKAREVSPYDNTWIRR